MQSPAATRKPSGFSLVELAIVLTVVALLAGGLFAAIAAQRQAADDVDARRQLEGIREALLGYAMANGRLPCPAPAGLPTGDTAAGRAGDPPCDDARQHGVLPWATLGLSETDPWGNRFSYFASAKFTGALGAGALSSFTLASGSPEATPADNAGTANVKETRSSGANIAADLPAVVISHGRNGAGAWQPAGVRHPAVAGDEAENADDDLTFVARTPGEGFDDVLTWVAPSILKAKMVAAGRLP